MIARSMFVLFAVAAICVRPADADDVVALLTRAVDAFRQNESREKNWNWRTVETRELVDKSGHAVETFPSVTSESVIRSDGRRCDVIVAWGDGRKPYLSEANSDERCQAMDAIRPPFPPLGVLLNHRAKLLSRTSNTITLEIEPDKSKLKNRDDAIRCGASIRARVTLDAASMFPLRIEGEVAESGCESVFKPVVQYETLTRSPMTAVFRKSATFWAEWSLQKDKTGDSGKDFWILSAQHYSQPWNSDTGVFYYWGRQVRVHHEAHRIVKDMKTTAQEFTAGSEVIFR
jgi:hypothetical protein